LILTNKYFVGLPSQATVTVQDTDTLSTNVAVAAANAPNGIDYHTNSNALIVSVETGQSSLIYDTFLLAGCGLVSKVRTDPFPFLPVSVSVSTFPFPLLLWLRRARRDS